MNQPYTVASTAKPLRDDEVGDWAASPVTVEQRAQLDGYVPKVQEIMRMNGFSGMLGAESIKCLSERINIERGSYGHEQRVVVANLFGAFLGASLIESLRGAQGRWVSGKQGIGVEFQGKDSRRYIILPIERVFKQIDHGDEYSIYSYFLACSGMVGADSVKTPLQRVWSLARRQSGYAVLVVAAIVAVAFMLYVKH